MRVFIMLIASLLGFYQCNGEVVEHNQDVSLIETLDGNLWECYDDIPEGRAVTMLMYNNGTSSIYDDIIVRIREES